MVVSSEFNPMGQVQKKLLPQIPSSCTQVIVQILIDKLPKKGTCLAIYVIRLLSYVQLSYCNS